MGTLPPVDTPGDQRVATARLHGRHAKSLGPPGRHTPGTTPHVPALCSTAGTRGGSRGRATSDGRCPAVMLAAGGAAVWLPAGQPRRQTNTGIDSSFSLERFPWLLA